MSAFSARLTDPETYNMVVGAGPRGRPGVVLGVVQVRVIEQLLCVHADGRAHVQAQLPLEELPLARQTLFRVHLP